MKFSWRILFALQAALPILAVAAEQRPVLQAWVSQEPRAHSVLVREVRWVVPAACLPARNLGSDAAGRDLGAANADRDLGAANAGRDLGADAAGRDLGAGASGRELGGDAAGRDLGAANAGRDLGAGVAGRDLGGANAGRDLGSGAGGRSLGADAAGRDLGADAATRALGAANSALACDPGEDGDSVIVHGVAPRDFALPDDSGFKHFTQGPEVNSVRVYL